MSFAFASNAAATSMSARAVVASNSLRRGGSSKTAKPMRSVVTPRAALADIPTDNKATKVRIG